MIEIQSFAFEQLDYGISYKPFWDSIHLQDALLSSVNATESNRCFFLHLGMKTETHPFALQYAFRQRAAKILICCSHDMPSDELSTLKELYLPPLTDVCSKPEFSSMVDANILLACWPLEWKNFRIIIWNKNAKKWSIYEPFPDDDNLEIILRFSSNHFTLLRYKYGSVNGRLRLMRSNSVNPDDMFPTHGYSVDIYDPDSFACANPVILCDVQDDCEFIKALKEPFSIGTILSPFYHAFSVRTIPSLKESMAKPQWPPMNREERSLISHFPQPCKKSGYFHSCCGSDGNCMCGLPDTYTGPIPCADDECYWTFDEDPYHSSHQLPVQAYEHVLGRIAQLVPILSQRFTDAREDKGILIHCVLERLYTIFLSLQASPFSSNTERDASSLKESLNLIKDILSPIMDALKGAEYEAPVAGLPEPIQHLQLASNLLSVIAVAKKTLPVELQSQQSTQSEDIPVIASDPKYALEIEDQCLNALNYASFIYSLVSDRILTITDEGKPIAIQQLDALFGKIDFIAGELTRIFRGVNSLTLKRAINVQSLDKAMVFASSLASELRKLIELVRDSKFPAANLALAGKAQRKMSKRAAPKASDHLLIPRKILQSFCESVDSIFEKEKAATQTPTDGFATLVDSDSVRSADEKFDDEAATNNAIQQRERAGSKFSRFADEAHNVHSRNANKDSYESDVEESENSEDRAFIDDVKPQRSSTNHRALFAQQVFKDAGVLGGSTASPRKISERPLGDDDSIATYCNKGHLVRTLYKIPRDNAKRHFSNRIICEHCIDTIPYSVPAYSCPCGTKVVCVRCIRAGATYSPPPKCQQCKADLHSTISLTVDSSCCICSRHNARRSYAWKCSSASCNVVYCEQCIPPPSLARITSTPPSSSSSSASHAESVSAASSSSSGLTAPMPGQSGP
jgi:hypothetical protein